MSAAFKAFFARALPNVTAFSAEEFLVKGASNSHLRLNTDPPEELWPNIVPTARVLQELRDRIGKPIILHSVYRSPAYNRAIGGAGQSVHMSFGAADFHVVDPNSGPADWAATLRAMRSAGLFKGGIGAYETFVHVDTRGTNADFDQIDARNGRVLPARAQTPPLTRPVPAPPPPPPQPSAGDTLAPGAALGGAAVAIGGGLASGNSLFLWIGGAVVIAGIIAFLVIRARKRRT